MKKTYLFVAVVCFMVASCKEKSTDNASVLTPQKTDSKPLVPKYFTDKTPEDSDDPCIWIDMENRENSLIIGTDKSDLNGGLFVFDLKGKMIPEKCVTGLQRPNNVDLEYGFKSTNETFDIAVCTERGRNKIRVIRVPEMVPMDNGGIDVFENETDRLPMGIGLYKTPSGEIHAILSRKTGPTGEYLWQYLLYANEEGIIKGKLLRKFGVFQGKEIESVLVDDEAGYVYYSDETVGVRQYHADPSKGKEELALFATSGIKSDHEGLSLYRTGSSTGYILLSDQQANLFWIFKREGTAANPFEHELVKKVATSTISSDGSETTSYSLGNEFPNGLFVAMSEGALFQLYDWNQLAGEDLIRVSR